MILNRRQLLQTTGAAVLGSTAIARASVAQAPKILFFTKSVGFEHSVVRRGGDELAHAERIFLEVAKSHGYDATVSKDGRLFDPDQIGEWDAFVFCTTGDLDKPSRDGGAPMTPAGKRAFLDAIKQGVGFVGMHCATDTFHSGPTGRSEFIEMIGGEFTSHGKQQEAMIDVVDPDFPGVKPFGDRFQLLEEWFAFRNISPEMHVIMVQLTEDMEGKDYNRPNYPMTWSKNFGDGKVFYTSMGHREDTWTNPDYQNLLMGGLDFVTGKVPGSVEVDVERVTPGFQITGG